MKAWSLCLASLFLVAAGAGATGQEDYGHRRLPPIAYQRMVIQPDPPAPPQPLARAAQPIQPACEGTGCPPTEAAVANQLLASGPSTREIYANFESTANQFAAVGFVRENWPLSIEYRAQPDTVTVLRIKLYHQRKILIFPIPFYEVAFEANLDALPAERESDDPWHRTVMIPRIHLSREADPAADGGLHVARYELRSYHLVDGQIERRNGHPVRVPVVVPGITVGPQVVGSLTLTGLAFDGGARIPPAGNPPVLLRYRYRTDRRYDLLKEEMEKYSDAGLEYRFEKQLGSPHSAGLGLLDGPPWQVRSRQKPGRYRLAVTGWWNCGGVTLADKLAACPDNPNWAMAYSDPLDLAP